MRLRLFGPVAVVDPDGEVAADPPAQKKLLALLALRTGQAVPTDRLIDEMWGEEPPANAEQIVRTYVDGWLAEVGDTAAELAAATGDTTTAARLLAWTDHRRETLGVARDPFEEDQAATLRSRVGERPEGPDATAARAGTADLLVEFLG